MNSNSDYEFKRIHPRNQAQQSSKPDRGIRGFLNATNQNSAQQYRAFDLDVIDASCYYRSIYQSAKRRNMLLNICFHLCGSNTELDEYSFVSRHRYAIASYVTSVPESYFTEFLSRSDNTRPVVGMFGSKEHRSCDYRLLAMRGQICTEFPDLASRYQALRERYWALITEKDFWPSDFEINWIKRQLHQADQIHIVTIPISAGNMLKRNPLIDIKTGATKGHKQARINDQ